MPYLLCPPKNMKIAQYIQSILPVVGKAAMVEDLRLARTNLEEFRSLFESADKAIGRSFKSEEAKRLQQTFANLTRVRGSKNMLATIGDGIPSALQTIIALEAMVAGEFEEKIATQGVNYKKATLLQLTDASSFIARFSLKLYSYVLACEITKVRQEKKLNPDHAPVITDAAREAILDGMGPFCVAWAAFVGESGDIVEKLSALPDAIVSDANYSVLKSQLGEKTIDPFSLGTYNFKYSPVRWIRMRRVESADARYREAQNEYQMNKLRLVQLQQLAAGREDAALDREIAYVQRMIESLESEIEELEKP